MKNILDYYYLVLVRVTGIGLDYQATGLMSFTFSVNIFSLAIFLNHQLLDRDTFWIIIGIILMVIYSILSVIYNKKRRDSIIMKHKEETYDSWLRGVVLVVLYILLSIGFLVLSISIAV